MARSTKGRALFLHRDSGGRHETTPGQYVEWAQRKANELGLSFDGTPARIEQMIREGLSQCGDLFHDDAVCGNQLTRAGLDALIEEALNDENVSHMLCPRRDRIARPDDPTDAIKIETNLRKAGLTLVFQDRIVAPLGAGQRVDIADHIVALIDYDAAGRFRRDLAHKMIYAQITLARMGFSTGGRAPYGFRRWLVHEDGKKDRQLADKEYVRKARHHVVWLPGPEEELAVIRRIVELLKTTPASIVAKILTREGVPSPDAGRMRTDNGIGHQVSGNWNQTTVTNIGRNPLLVAITQHGIRSMGDQARFTPEGPRNLTENDLREPGKPKVIRNLLELQIQAPASFTPLVDPEEHRKLIEILDQRGGTQRGKPRSRDPKNNPLGCRVFDMNCSWTMYRATNGDSYDYRCGQYTQSHGEKCSHNRVNGPLAVQFVLSSMQQRLLSPRLLPKLKSRLTAMARQTHSASNSDSELNAKRAELKRVIAEVQQVARNLSFAKSEEQYNVVSKVFDELKAREKTLEKDVARLEAISKTETDVDGEINKAMMAAERFVDRLQNQERAETACELIQMVDVRLYLRFREVQSGKRTLNKVAGGILTFGETPAPIKVYSGPTEKTKKLNSRESKSPAVQRLNRVSPGGEENSLGNVNRDDRI